MNNAINNNSNPPKRSIPPTAFSATAAGTNTAMTTSGRTITAVSSNTTTSDVQRNQISEPAQQLTSSPTTTNSRSTTSWWLRWGLIGGLATTAASYTNPYTSPIGTNENTGVTSGETNGVTTTHPTEWTVTQHSTLENAVHNAGGSSISKPTLSLEEQQRQGARPRPTQPSRNEQTQQKHNNRNRRWAKRQETASRIRRTSGQGPSAPQTCGDSKNYDPHRAAVASGKGSDKAYAGLGGFLQCRGENYLNRAAAMGNPDAAWQKAQRILGQTMGPDMQPSAEALHAMAYARNLGSPKATEWVDKFIELQMHHANAYMEGGTFEPEQKGDDYTESSLYFLHQAARAGLGDAQAMAARLFAKFGQWTYLWEVLELLVNNTGFLQSKMTDETRTLIRWICNHLIEFQAGGIHAGVDQQKMIQIIQLLSNFAHSHFN